MPTEGAQLSTASVRGARPICSACNLLFQFEYPILYREHVHLFSVRQSTGLDRHVPTSTQLPPTPVHSHTSGVLATPFHFQCFNPNHTASPIQKSRVSKTEEDGTGQKSHYQNIRQARVCCLFFSLTKPCHQFFELLFLVDEN